MMGLISEMEDSLSCMTWYDALRIGCISAGVVGLINLSATIATEALANQSFNYSVDEEGNVCVTGEIKTSVLNNCFIVEKKDQNGKLGLSIINKDGIDILTNEFVTSIHEVDGCIISVDDDIYSVAKMSDFYVSDEDKLLSPDDVRNIIMLIGQDFPWHNYKVLSYSY